MDLVYLWIKLLFPLHSSYSIKTLPIHSVLISYQKCRGFGVKRVFLSGIIYTKRIPWQILNDVHDRLVSLFERLEINYIDNRNIWETHLFKDGLHLLDTGKRILADNFIFNLNNFLYQIQQPILLT